MRPTSLPSCKSFAAFNDACHAFGSEPPGAASAGRLIENVALLEMTSTLETGIPCHVSPVNAGSWSPRITLIRGDHDPAFTGDTWHGMPVSRVDVISNKATFSIKRPADAAPGGSLPNAWQASLKAAKDLQDGKEVGRIGYYAPDIVIKGNMIDSITGFGFLYSKGK